MPAPQGATRLYTRSFFVIFVATGLFMTGVALQFHFGQYIAFLGYKVDTLGLILSVSMIGTLLIRLFIGRWVDRFGCRPVWLIGAAISTLAVGTLQFAHHVWLITLLRLIGTMAMAAVMTTVAVFAAQIAPVGRRAESIGTIGLAGFLGMIIGPAVGDLIFSNSTPSIVPYSIFFSASACCSFLAGLIVLFISLPTDRTRVLSNAARPVRSVGSQLAVIRRHWPGMILLIGIIFALAFCIQSMYLERLAEARGFKDIKLFFFCYCPTAMFLRLYFRRLPQQIGRTRTVLLGLGLLACGQLLLVGIASQSGLVLPGILMGAGHCFIFPSMVDLGADRLPPEDRGTGTALILGAGDIGMLIGYGVLGELIDTVGFDGMLKILAGTVLVSAVLFAVARRRDVFLPVAKVR